MNVVKRCSFKKVYLIIEKEFLLTSSFSRGQPLANILIERLVQLSLHFLHNVKMFVGEMKLEKKKEELFHEQNFQQNFHI